MKNFVASFRSSLVVLAILFLCYCQDCHALPHPSGGGSSSSGGSSSRSDAVSERSGNWTENKLLLGGSIAVGIAAIAAALLYAYQNSKSDGKETTVSPEKFIPNQLMKETLSQPQVLAAASSVPVASASASSAKRWVNPAVESGTADADMDMDDSRMMKEEQIRTAAVVLASAAMAGRHSQRNLVPQQGDIELGERPMSNRTLDQYPRLEEYPPIDQGLPQPASKRDLIRAEFNVLMEAQKAKLQPEEAADAAVESTTQDHQALSHPQQLSRRDLIQAEFAAMMEEQKAKMQRTVNVDP